MEDLTRILQNLLNSRPFFVIGNLLSIASFILTIFVLLNVRKIRNVYKLRARGPSLIKELSKSASNLSSFLNEYNEFIPQVTEELGRVAVKLRSLERKLSGSPKRSVAKVLAHIDRCEVSAQNEEQVRKAYIEIMKIVEELKENQKDLDWEL